MNTYEIRPTDDGLVELIVDGVVKLLDPATAIGLATNLLVMAQRAQFSVMQFEPTKVSA